jgi:hypothetical protein
MGQKLFTGGQVTIETDQTQYLPGQIVNGTIFVEQKETYHASALCLSFIGSEHTHWTEKRGKQTHTFRDDNLLIRLDYKIQDFAATGNECPLGKYQFPFTVQLPLNLPPSLV